MNECKRDVLGERWTVCDAPGDGPCYCDVVVQATIKTECAMCYTDQTCFDDGEAYICVDRDACRVRAADAIEGSAA